MTESIVIELTHEDWVEIGKTSAKYVGQRVDPMPHILFIQALVDAGISTKELKE